MKWLMDTGCGHDLIGRAKAKSLGVDIVKDDDEIVFQTANGCHFHIRCGQDSRGRVGRDCRATCIG